MGKVAFTELLYIQYIKNVPTTVYVDLSTAWHLPKSQYCNMYRNKSFRDWFLTLDLNLAFLKDTGSRSNTNGLRFQSSGQDLINIYSMSHFMLFLPVIRWLLARQQCRKDINAIKIKPDGATYKDKSFKQPSQNLSLSLFDYGSSIT